MKFHALLRLLSAVAVGASALVAALPDAQAQWPRNDGFFIFRDPFRPQYRPPPPAYPRESLPRREPVAPPEPAGPVVYGSSDAADRFRETQAEQYVLVLGDTLADQLAQGLVDGIATERPEVAIVKKTRSSSGLVRADFYDWPAQVPGLMENEKINAIVVILGTNDRQVLRDETGAHEFRSDRWRELYAARVDAMINAVKAKGVPVIVVGQPSMQNPRLHADMPYINEILRERTQAAGVLFADVWDGFVNEAEEFITMGPALDGQTRRLRVSDGVHFTREGARKIAHYVERDLIRLFDRRGPQPLIPLDSPDAAPSTPAERPIAGPVLPLNQPAGPVGQLAGGGARKPGDGIANRVLVEGMPVEPVVGRADDFRWQPPAAAAAEPEGKAAAPASAAAPAPAAAPAGVIEVQPKANAPLPTIITPQTGGQKIIAIPEVNRPR